MKKIFLLLINLTFISQCYSQTDSCEYVLYELILKETLMSKHLLDISLDYTPEKNVLESLKASKTFSSKEFTKLNKVLENDIDGICKSTREKILELIEGNKERGNGSYEKHLYSKPITVSKSKKCIFSIVVAKNVKYKGGKAIGSEIAYIFNKKGDEWRIIDKKILDSY